MVRRYLQHQIKLVEVLVVQQMLPEQIQFPVHQDKLANAPQASQWTSP